MQDKYKKGAKSMNDPVKWQKIKIQYFNGMIDKDDLQAEIRRTKIKVNHAR